MPKHQDTTSDTPVSKALATLSKPRLDAYRRFFKEDNDDQVLSYYLWSQALATAFSPLIALVEIALRNKIHKSLSTIYSGKTSESFPWYDHHQKAHANLKGKTLIKVNELLLDSGRLLHPQPSPDKVVSELSFGVWHDVLQQLRGNEAAHVFLSVFSNHPKGKIKHWSYYPNRDRIIQRIKRVQLLRNRICHHEAIWKPHFLDIETGRHWSFTVQALRIEANQLVELLNWISPELRNIHANSFAGDWLNNLCSTSAVLSFLSNHRTAALLRPIGAAQIS